MILEGGFSLAAPIDKLFDFVMKPETILACMPGAESVTLLDATTYECVMKQKVGPVSVKMKSVNKLTKLEKPNHVEIEGEGQDATKLGHFKQKAMIDLKETSPGQVEVKYRVDVNIVGKLAMFGDRVMRALAKDIEKEFTKRLQEKLKEIA